MARWETIVAQSTADYRAHTFVNRLGAGALLVFGFVVLALRPAPRPDATGNQASSIASSNAPL